MKFNELNLIEPILTSLEKMKYLEPSPIQAKTIPVMLEGRDMLGCAQTGSGKTAAFALPILQRLAKEESDEIRSLILTPTRELAIQIRDNMNQFGENLNLKTEAVYGGVDYDEQLDILEEGVDILVATPGRLLDLIKQGYIKLRHVEVLVLDEADRMLDMGFINDIRALIKKIPVGRQTVMFSATMPKPIQRLSDTILREPETIIQDDVTNTVDTISQFVYHVDDCNKLALLTSLIKSGDVKNAIVFTNTRRTAELVSKHLTKAYVRARAIHSEKNQNSRQDALLQFKNKKVQVLVATDVAARGIDIKELSHVFNYEIPDNAESYIHRIGRTGRAGAEGTAISFCCIDELDDMERIEEHIGMKLPILDSEWSMKVFTKKAKPAKRGQQQAKDEVFDISKVKDVGIDGKPRKKKSNFQYHKERAARAKNAEEQRSFGRSGSGKSGRSATGSKNFKWSDSKKSGGSQKSYGGRKSSNTGYSGSGSKSSNHKSTSSKKGFSK